MVRARIFSCTDNLLRSETETADAERFLSSSWPAVFNRQKTQAPQAPVRKPSWAEWEVSPLTLDAVCENGPPSRSASITTLGDDLDDETFVFSLDDGASDDECADDGGDQDESLYDVTLFGSDEQDGELLQSPVIDEELVDSSQRDGMFFGAARSIGASPGPVLLTVLAQIASRSDRENRRRRHTWDPSQDIGVPALRHTRSWSVDCQPAIPEASLSSSWPAATMPLRSLQQPPRAPSRRPSAAPWEVMPLQLPISPARLIQADSPRPLSRSGSDTSLGKRCPEIEALGVDEEESLAEECIFHIDGLNGSLYEEAEALRTFAGSPEEDEESPTEAKYGDLTGFALDDPCSHAGDRDNYISERVASTAAYLMGASPVLLSVLWQVAADTQSCAVDSALYPL